MSEDLGDGKATSDEMLSPEQRTTMETEGEQSVERTRESEIQANIEFWKGHGLEVDEADIRSEIGKLPEVEGFDWYLFIPKGMKNSDVYRLIGGRFGVDAVSRCFTTFGEKEMDNIVMPRTSENAYAIALRHSKEVDKEFYEKPEYKKVEVHKGYTPTRQKFKSAVDYEQTDEQFATLLELMIAEARWEKENRSHLNYESATMCPGCRTKSSKLVPVMTYHSVAGNVQIWGNSPDYENEGLGVRRVVTSETKTEIEE